LNYGPHFIAEHIFSLISSKISEYEGKLDFAKFTTTEDMHREYSRFLEWKESILNEQDKYIKRIKKQIIDDTNKQVDAYLNTKLAS
jgi:vacuolar-type H+-ATPase subunit H